MTECLATTHRNLLGNRWLAGYEVWLLPWGIYHKRDSYDDQPVFMGWDSILPRMVLTRQWGLPPTINEGTENDDDLTNQNPW